MYSKILIIVNIITNKNNELNKDQHIEKKIKVIKNCIKNNISFSDISINNMQQK